MPGNTPVAQQQVIALSADAEHWSVEDVARWLRSRGFDKDVCDKFTGVFFLRLLVQRTY